MTDASQIEGIRWNISVSERALDRQIAFIAKLETAGDPMRLAEAKVSLERIKETIETEREILTWMLAKGPRERNG